MNHGVEMGEMNNLSDKQIIHLLAIYDISAGDFEAEIPISEIEKYVTENWDSLKKRVEKGKKKRSEFKEESDESS